MPILVGDHEKIFVDVRLGHYSDSNRMEISKTRVRQDQYIAALDVGTTKVKCVMVDKIGNAAHTADAPVELLYPEPGHVEIDPSVIWESSCHAIRLALNAGRLTVDQINAIGITCHRNTFLTWNRKSGFPYHRLITWKDRRADTLIKNINSSMLFTVGKIVAKALYFVTRIDQFLTASGFEVENVHVVGRLLWATKKYPQILIDAEKGEVAFGTLDTWLLYKFGIEGHITDFSHASATAMFDPYKLSWMTPLLWYLGLPKSILPVVVESSGTHFGSISSDIFGKPIPLRASIADQSASLFGSFCLDVGSVKLTMGTGAFLDIVAGKAPRPFASGFSPIVAWSVGTKTTYASEGGAPDFGTVIDWAINSGLGTDVVEITNRARAVSNSDGVSFIPAFHGLRTPVRCSTAQCGFIGLKSTSTVDHMLRAVLESLAFICASLYESYAELVGHPSVDIRVDGGVANNDFILQKLANLTGVRVIRYKYVERTAIGAAYMAGIANGFWKGVESIPCPESTVFSPEENEIDADNMSFMRWKTAVKPFCIL